MPLHGSVDASMIRHIAVPLKKVSPLNLKIAGGPVSIFKEVTVNFIFFSRLSMFKLWKTLR